MKKISLVAAILISLGSFSQEKIDGIAAVINEEIIIQSELKAQFEEFKSQNFGVETECDALEGIMQEKLLIAEAKKDTLITINDRALKPQVDEMANGAISKYGEEETLKLYGFATMQELKQEILRNLQEQSYSEQIRAKITGDIDASPLEVNTFFREYESQLPNVEEEIELSQIVIKPKLTEEHKQELINKLLEIKKEIEDGASFATMAIVHSEGPSSVDGGMLANTKRGQMVKDFEAVAYNLEEGEISEPFETDFGFHIATLEKRRGEVLDLRHILLLNKPNEKEMEKAKELADSIKAKIDQGVLSFEDAVKEFSDDKDTRLNKGVVADSRTGNTRFVRTNLPTNMYLEVTGVKEHQLTSPFEDTMGRDEKVYKIMRVEQIIPAHKINLKDDYERIKKFTVNKKKQEKIDEWVKQHISDNFIKIDDDYKTCPFKLKWLH
ncbi:MAG: peptidylprolyl isomerase [Flavobacteriales bacterium]